MPNLPSEKKMLNIPRNSHGLKEKRQKLRKRLTKVGCWRIQYLNSEDDVFRKLSTCDIDISGYTYIQTK